MGFTFSYDFVQSSEVTVQSLEEFYLALKDINVSSIQFHVERGDFERWLSQVVGDNILAGQIIEAKRSKRKLKDETLRKRILAVTGKRLKQLKKITDGKATSLKKKKK
jgi:hypothetical protein